MKTKTNPVENEELETPCEQNNETLLKKSNPFQKKIILKEKTTPSKKNNRYAKKKVITKNSIDIKTNQTPQKKKTKPLCSQKKILCEKHIEKKKENHFLKGNLFFFKKKTFF